MKGNLFKTFLLTLIVVAALMGMFFMPRLSFGDTELRRVNILADVEQRHKDCGIIDFICEDSVVTDDMAVADSTAVEAERKRIYVDEVPQGMVAIEDRLDSVGTGREMDKFYRALSCASERNVRIAYFGDSYIEGDILTQDLRHLFQERFGGKGVGFVDIMSPTAGFRQTVTQTAAGWRAHHANDAKELGFEAGKQGINGRYFIPSGQAVFGLRGQKRLYGAQLDTMETATVFFTPCGGLRVSVSVNGAEYYTLFEDCDTSEQRQSRVMAQSVNGHIGRFDMSVDGRPEARFYGVALEGRCGVTVDNFSMRGSNGWHISGIPEGTMRRFAQLRPYDLIVLHYGLNVASPKMSDYSYYTKRFVKTINLLKAAYPEASILVVGVGDRDAKDEYGELHTMKGVRELLYYQRNMAAETHVAFWNLYDAMGGDGSMVRMVEKKQANLDYTHINFAGGKHIARLLFDVMMNGKDNYEKRESL
ncbi:MAG: hypothetical protein NC206_07855 [Bacteroides sp.]|nr:hypothetical protein [Roseburia sp.]MCM1346985.1 hypothetical protein [Bacteroides sp.]MCM1421817.1 hypothetical protein [Bacteroides sp.]